jgi:hypothetical protein
LSARPECRQPFRSTRSTRCAGLLDAGLSCDPCPFIKEGMPVVVTHGPLKGVSGRLVCKGPHAMLVVSIELIGRAVSVRIHAADVQAA